MTLLKCFTQYASKFWKLSSGHRTGKGQFSFQSQRRAVPKNVQTTIQFAFISHASKVMLKILQARHQQYVKWELPDIQVGFRKGRGTRDLIANIRWIIEKAREFQKTNTSTPLTTLMLLIVWVTTNCRKFFKRWEYQTTLTISWETCMQGKKQQLEPNMEQWTGSKLGKECVKAVHCHLAYLTSVCGMCGKTFSQSSHLLGHHKSTPGRSHTSAKCVAKPLCGIHIFWDISGSIVIKNL